MRNVYKGYNKDTTLNSDYSYKKSLKTRTYIFISGAKRRCQSKTQLGRIGPADRISADRLALQAGPKGRGNEKQQRPARTVSRHHRPIEQRPRDSPTPRPRTAERAKPPRKTAR